VRGEIGESEGRSGGDGLSGVRGEEEVAGGRADFADDWRRTKDGEVRAEGIRGRRSAVVRVKSTIRLS